MGIKVALLQLIHKGICSISGLYPHLHPQSQLKLRLCTGIAKLNKVSQGQCIARCHLYYLFSVVMISSLCLHVKTQVPGQMQ